MPPGSILGSLLFLLYISDLCYVSKADNFFSHEDPNQLMEIVKTELKKLLSWFQGNKLSINIYKPVHMVN